MNQKSPEGIFPYNTALSNYIFIPLFISGLLTWLLFHNAGFSLEHFRDRSISLASMEGIDITARVRTFYKGIFFFSGVAILMIWMFSYLLKILDASDLNILNTASAAGLLLLPFQVIGADLSLSLQLIFTILLTALIGILSKYIYRKRGMPADYDSAFSWIFCSSFCLFFIPYFLLGTSMPLSLFQFTGLQSSLFITLFLSNYKPDVNSKEWLYRIIRRTSIIAFIPLAGILSVELSMISGQRGIFISEKSIFLVLLVLMMIYYFVRGRKKQVIISDNSSLSTTWLPAILVAISCFALYHRSITPDIDWFEDANRILPVQQLYEFGRIPFLDTFSSHALYDFAPGLLYSILNGYHPLGGFLYSFLVPLGVSLISYFLLLKISNKYAAFAFFFMLLFPYTEFFLPAYFNFIPLTLLILFRIHRDPSRFNYLMFVTWILFMIIWRIDLGSANLLASLITVIVWMLMNRQKEWQLKNLFRALILAGSFLLLAFIIAYILRGDRLFTSLSEALGYLSSFQSYGRKDLAPAMDIRYYSLYFLMPAAVLFVAGLSIYRYIKNKTAAIPALSILFFTCFYFANFQRGLVRHTLAEDWDTALTSYGFFVLLAGVWSIPLRQLRPVKLFFLFGVLAFLLLVNYKFQTPDLKRSNIFQSGLVRLPEFALREHSAINEPRIVENPEYRKSIYGQLDDFMKKEFADSATFFDFSNTPMLYSFLHRRSPDYLCQLPHTAHNDKMQNFLLKHLKHESVPVVIFNSVNETFWDQLDGISNRVRHYKISEYIYKNYKPYQVISGKNIWLRNDLAEKMPVDTLYLVDTKVQEDNLKLIPYLWGNYDESFQKSGFTTLLNLKDNKELLKNEHEVRYRFTELLNTASAYIYIRMNATEKDAEVILNFGNDDIKSGGFVFKAKKADTDKDYLVRISTQYNWFARENNWVSLYPMGSDLDIQQVKIVGGD